MPTASSRLRKALISRGPQAMVKSQCAPCFDLGRQRSQVTEVHQTSIEKSFMSGPENPHRHKKPATTIAPSCRPPCCGYARAINAHAASRSHTCEQWFGNDERHRLITANLTPRKCLGFKTPFQAILKELGKDAQIRFSRRASFGGCPTGRVSRWPILSCKMRFAGNRIAYLIRSASRNS